MAGFGRFIIWEKVMDKDETAKSRGKSVPYISRQNNRIGQPKRVIYSSVQKTASVPAGVKVFVCEEIATSASEIMTPETEAMPADSVGSVSEGENIAQAAKEMHGKADMSENAKVMETLPDARQENSEKSMSAEIKENRVSSVPTAAPDILKEKLKEDIKEILKEKVKEVSTEPSTEKAEEKPKEATDDISAEPVKDKEEEIHKETPMEAHLRKIAEQIEEGHDPSVYETYVHETSSVDPSIALYAARRRGLSHISSGKPCQDDCLVTSVEGCTIMADADGVSSCAHSDVGSHLACEAVVSATEAAAKSAADEEELVRRLLSPAFRKRLVDIWVKRVMEIVRKTPDVAPADVVKEFASYGTTLMYAIWTAHYIVVGNVGDGQILVFNDDFGVKLRVHAPKESSRVRCLANERCAKEDFLVAVYPRSEFSGVLLSTDGMYESLDKTDHFYRYAMQMKERFAAHEAPYEPFCYLEEGEEYKDFSRMRTEDDCSIVLAFEKSKAEETEETAETAETAADNIKSTADAEPSEYAKITKSIADDHARAFLFKRFASGCLSFYAKINKDGYSDIFVTHKDAASVLPTSWPEGVLPEKAWSTWEDGGYRYRAYGGKGAPTLEFMHASGMLRRDKADPETSEARILGCYTAISRLRKQLAKEGLTFSAAAPFALSYDGKTLYVREEAIAQVAEAPLFDAVDACFAHLLGALETEEARIPVLDIGYIDRGITYFIPGAEKKKWAKVVRKGKKLCLKNVGHMAWQEADGTLTHPDEACDTEKTKVLTWIDSHGESAGIFRFVAKEDL